MEKKSKFRRFLIKVRSMRVEQICGKMKKLFNVCWKVGAALIGVVITITIIEEIIDFVKDVSGLSRYYWMDESLEGNIEIRYFSNHTCATFDNLTGERISPRVKWISGVPERDSLTVFCDKDGNRGFLNVNTGKIVIEGQYEHAWHFSEGLAAVVADNGKVGFINYDNEMVIPAEFDYIAGNDYIFESGVCILTDAENDLRGAIDMLGNMLLPFEYSSIRKEYCERNWFIKKNGKLGLADENMNIIFEPLYENIHLCDYESAYLTLHGVKQLVSFEGEVIHPFVIDETWPLQYPVKINEEESEEYEMHPYLVEFKVDYNSRGVMDSRNGKIVIPALYTDIDMISRHLISADISWGDEKIIFDTSGARVNPD